MFRDVLYVHDEQTTLTRRRRIGPDEQQLFSSSRSTVLGVGQLQS